MTRLQRLEHYWQAELERVNSRPPAQFVQHTRQAPRGQSSEAPRVFVRQAHLALPSHIAINYTV